MDHGRGCESVEEAFAAEAGFGTYVRASLGTAASARESAGRAVERREWLEASQRRARADAVNAQSGAGSSVVTPGQ
jgi:hypothetical protein